MIITNNLPLCSILKISDGIINKLGNIEKIIKPKPTNLFKLKKKYLFFFSFKDHIRKKVPSTNPNILKKEISIIFVNNYLSI